DCYRVNTSAGVLECTSLVVATGGLSIPKIGATGFGYDIARQFDIKTTSIRAALVPLVFSGTMGETLRELRGVSLEAIAHCGKMTFRENILFTHRGLSGPAILQISTYWKPGDSIVVDTLPEPDSDQRLPRRFVQTWNELYAPKKPRSQWSRSEIDEFEH